MRLFAAILVAVCAYAYAFVPRQVKTVSRAVAALGGSSRRRVVAVVSQSRLYAGFAITSSANAKKNNEEDDDEEGSIALLNLTAESPCPCGSDNLYGQCCSPYHKGEQKPPDPISLVRARYSAYALSNPDYSLDTTSPQSPDYLAYIESPIGARSGRKKWVKDVRKNMIDDFMHVRMAVDNVELSDDGNSGVVTFRHLAIKKTGADANTMYPILENSKCVKINGAWLYESGDVQRPEPDASQAMMEDWPLLAGLRLKGKGGQGDEVVDNGEGSAQQERPARQPRPRRATRIEPGAVAPPTVRGGKR